jgi:hypothetical protein
VPPLFEIATFSLPARLAETRRRKIVVAMDEFQVIGHTMFMVQSGQHRRRASTVP